ncbi:NrsF family protein [uncultured Albimonas sp.]|uniref:NrsF family protein n=1 Tax=uncultured Albimonas sp. TaxID=1331701 RepID=UPI0030ECFD46
MTTDELIRRLSAEAPAPRPRLELRLFATLSAGLLALGLWVATRYGVRADLPATLATSAGALKFVGGAALALAAGRLACRLSRPGSRPEVCPLSVATLVLAALALGWTAAGAALSASLAPAGAASCARSILLLSAPILAGALLTLRVGAPTRPAATGALAGVAAGAMACLAYALWCPADGVAFVALSYGGAIAVAGLAGALAGGRVLAW